MFIGACEFTQSRVRNVLAHNGVPVIWERGTAVRVKTGRLTMEGTKDMAGYEFLWEPGEPSTPWAVPVPEERMTTKLDGSHFGY